MRSKVKIISVVLCIVVIIGCYVGYSTAVSYASYDICTPYSCSLINGYKTEILWTIPASEAVEYGYGWENDLQVIEITYELYNPLNDRITIPGNLCYYYGNDDSWLYVYESAGSYSDISGYENLKILPPGESALFREYVLVPEGMKEIYAYGNCDGTQDMELWL